MIVAIDGPAGAGKTTVARSVAGRLGFDHLDTGALYRAATLLALESHAPLDDGAAIAALVAAADIEMGSGTVRLGGRDVTTTIRRAEVTAAVSQVAAHPAVRTALIPHQRAAASRDVVVEGRDIGTMVFPEAQVKIFLTADPQARAMRRARELADQRPIEELAAEMQARDLADSTRAASPLARADDAIVIDTSDMSIEAVVDAVVDAVESVRRAS